MKFSLPNNAKLLPVVGNVNLPFYKLDQQGLTNDYYVVSSPESCELMANPAVVGYTCLQALEPSTTAVLNYLNSDGKLNNPHILTILRGGLNFPLEQGCFNLGITVRSTDFVTCERVIEKGVITGLEIKYEKLIPERDATILIGDIVASGETLEQCMPLVAARYKEVGGSIKRIVFFTIGGTKAVPMMERMTVELRKLWPDFEGFACVFYEGIFTVYEDKGVTGVNTPDIDFGWQGGAVAPEFRSRVMDTPLALFEKCIIYDGGARRFEIPNHIDEVAEYWHELAAVASQSSLPDFLAEKLGYTLRATYEQWLDACHLNDTELNKALWNKETAVAASVLQNYTLAQVCETQLNKFEQQMAKFQ